MITKEIIQECISTVQDDCETHNQNQEKSPKQRKEKIQTKQKTLINKPILLSNRFSPMDIEDSIELTTHIKTDTINSKRDLIKNKYQRQPNRKWNNKSYQNKMKHKLQKVDIDQLQNQRKKIKNQLLPPLNRN